MDEAKATILVVDDEKSIRDLISRKLESEDYRCVVASDGENAIWKAFMQDFDLHDLSGRVSKALERRKLALEGRSYQRSLEQKVQQLETRLQHYQNRYVEMATSRQSKHVESPEQEKVAVGVEAAVKSREYSSTVEQAAGGGSQLVGSRTPTIWDDVGYDANEIAAMIGEEARVPP